MGYQRVYLGSGLRGVPPGRAVPILAAAMAMIIGLSGGLVVDVWLLDTARRSIQTAADAAAIACAAALREAQTVSVARAAATLNGFTDDSSAARVAVNNPRTSGT